MLRKFLFHVVPMLIPFIVYGIYWYGAKRREQEGKPVHPWAMLFACGLLLSILSFFVLSFTTGYDPTTEYIPPHMEDGKLVPSQNRPAE